MLRRLSESRIHWQLSSACRTEGGGSGTQGEDGEGQREPYTCSIHVHVQTLSLTNLST